MRLNLNQRVIKAESPEVPAIVEAATRSAEAQITKDDSIIDRQLPPIVEEKPIDSRRPKLTKLIDENFPFDESQLAAIHGMKSQKHACLTGAAGTGKTTCLKKLVDELQDSTAIVDMNTYFAKQDERLGAEVDPDEDYEITERFVPSICLAAFTGRASQMIKKNFPRDWHSNIMTIHRMLAFMPDYYEDFDEETQEVRNKMRFIPTYNAQFKLPWDIVIIDEAGMLGVDLYNMVLDALKPGARLYFVGDINQLPPTHGKSIFGFAMAKWPSWELTHIHRQVGVNNSIVDNAWRVLKGLSPQPDALTQKDWKFVMMPVDGDSNKASRYIRAALKKMQEGGVYDPIRDSIITPINAYEQCQGYALGQDPLNRELALMFNKSEDRYIIDAGRDRKYFAVGDKVMATRNDHEAGITNGMTGIITSIARNGNYQGDTRRFDTIANVNQYLNAESDEDEETFSLDDLSSMLESEHEAKERKEKEEGRDRGPASHIVTVKFGSDEHAFEIHFSSLAEVASLMTAYAVTCHKMQGGEAPFVIIILHQAHKRMLFREWFYTAITRGSGRVMVFYTKQGLANALNKQNIKGSTLAQKVQAFQAMVTKGIVGSAMNVRLPEPESMGRDMTLAKPTTIIQKGAANLAAELDSLEHAQPDPEPQPKVVFRDRVIVIERERAPRPEPKPASVVDGGELRGEAYQQMVEKRRLEGLAKIDKLMAPMKALPAPRKLVSQHGAVRMALQLSLEQEKKLLPYYPPAKPKLNLFGGKK